MTMDAMAFKWKQWAKARGIAWGETSPTLSCDIQIALMETGNAENNICPPPKYN